MESAVVGVVQNQAVQVPSAMAGDELKPGGAPAGPQHTAAKTSVWWDIENCPVPRGCNSNAIVQNVNRALMKMNYHGPVTITAYGDTNSIPPSIQRALSNTGIRLNHVPAAEVKDGCDKKILVDMLFWAMDNPAPANYLLISGSADLSHAIHQLRMRRYKILLAQPFSASSALVAAATNVWQWTSLATGGFLREHALRTNNANASGAQSFYNPGRYFDTKTKAIYVPKKSNHQRTMTGMSSMPAIVEDTNSSYCPQAPAVEPVLLAPHKSDSSENYNSRIEETSSCYCPHASAVAPIHFIPHHFFARSDTSDVKLGLESTS